jgi:hypothetical protein
VTGPTSRAELIELVSASFAKLEAELDRRGATLGKRIVVDDWTARDLLAVRAWWTHAVADWIEAGGRGETPVLPAEGYRWNETPRLNAELVRRARRESYRAVRALLASGVERVLAQIDELDDHALLDVCPESWTGRWPLARWISINTARQYATARTAIRRLAPPS